MEFVTHSVAWCFSEVRAEIYQRHIVDYLSR
jgi:hypothetical protein